MHDSDETTSHLNWFKYTNITLAVIVLVSTLLACAVFALNPKFGPAIFLNWFRHLTNWNALLTVLWLVLIGQMAPRYNTQLLSMGVAVVLLNLFVFFVRWGWFKIQPIARNPSLLFGDIIIHALVPLVALISFCTIALSIKTNDLSSSFWAGLVAFWVIVIIWYVLNYSLKHYEYLPWPYTNGAGISLPQDLFPRHHDQSRPFHAYMLFNIVIALLLSGLVYILVFMRKE